MKQIIKCFEQIETEFISEIQLDFDPYLGHRYRAQTIFFVTNGKFRERHYYSFKKNERVHE